MQKRLIFKDKEIIATDLKGNSGYIFYADRQALEKDVFNDPYIGKWIVKSDSPEEAVKHCLSAVSFNVVFQAKHSKEQKPLCFFYLNALDLEGHKKVIDFMFFQGMVKRTSSGKFCNLPYKLDTETLSGKYGKNSVLCHLSDFIDLDTGKGLPWLCK